MQNKAIPIASNLRHSRRFTSKCRSCTFSNGNTEPKFYQSYHIIYLFAQKFTRNSKCQHAVAELDGQGSKGAYKIKMEYNMNQ